MKPHCLISLGLFSCKGLDYQNRNRHQSKLVPCVLYHQKPSCHSSFTERQPSGTLGNG